MLITVGATLNEYRADSWPVGYDSEFDVRSQNRFYEQEINSDRRISPISQRLTKQGRNPRRFGRSGNR